MRHLTDSELEVILGAMAAESRSIWPNFHAPNSAPALTARQAQCLAWVAAGKTSAEVATILGLSRQSVDTYLAAASRRLGVTSRIAAVFIAQRTGQLDRPPENDECPQNQCD